MGQSEIVIKGAREHNLKDSAVTIPPERMGCIPALTGDANATMA